MRQPKEVYPAFYAGWSFVLCFIVCFGIFQTGYSLDSRWLSFSFAGLFSLVVLIYRMMQHDRLLMMTAVAPSPLPTPPPAQPSPPARPTFRPMVAPEPNRVLVGKFAFSDDQLSKIALVVTQAKGTFSRDVVEAARAIPDIKKVWPELKQDFERCGFILNNRLTAAGWELFTDSPTPPQGCPQ